MRISRHFASHASRLARGRGRLRVFLRPRIIRAVVQRRGWLRRRRNVAKLSDRVVFGATGCRGAIRVGSQQKG